MKFVTSNDRTHWETVYQTHNPTEVSWFQPEARLSLDLIRASAPSLRNRIIDVGGGASTLVDGLLRSGYIDVTVLDLSSTALAKARQRLGGQASRVLWVEADALTDTLPAASFDVWHDRAVFHFLRDEEDRRRYVAAVRRSLKPGGHILVATFGPEGPSRCSGLDVVRYTPEELHAEFGGAFEKVGSATEMHSTPWGAEQQFVYCYCRLRDS